jgi:hypothetical protein
MEVRFKDKKQFFLDKIRNPINSWRKKATLPYINLSERKKD